MKKKPKLQCQSRLRKQLVYNNCDIIGLVNEMERQRTLVQWRVMVEAIRQVATNSNAVLEGIVPTPKVDSPVSGQVLQLELFRPQP